MPPQPQPTCSTPAPSADAEFAGILPGRIAALEASEQRFRALVANALDVIGIADAGDPALPLRYLSPSIRTLWGHDPEALVGTTLLDLVHPEDQARLKGLREQCLEAPGENVSAELRLQYANGYWCISEVVFVGLLSEPGIHGIVLTCRDISERKAFEAQLSHQAFHDVLTGLPNRALFMERLRHAVARAVRTEAPLGVIFLDLDNFKVINDSLGHEAGDALLIAVTERLRASVRPGDTVARLGGDEFTVLLEDLADDHQVQGVAERMAEVLRTPILVAGREVFTTGSIGVVISRGEHQVPEELLRDADTAMYQAKTAGKAHCVVFDHSMNTRAVERLELENDLRRALVNREFRVFYQPIMSLESGRVTEFEALVRWQHPQHGIVLPAKFIPLAEEIGLIVPIGQWVLEEACGQAREWQRRYSQASLTMSVNISTRQMQQADLVEQVAQILQKTGLRPEALKLEITESMMMHDGDNTIAKLHQLKALGIRLAVDDFGTGYSSMAYLSSLPIDTLKIDRSFIAKMDHHAEDKAIVHAIVSLAKTLNLYITSEGIETGDQLTQLQALGCDRGQGYYLAHPLPSADIETLLAATVPAPRRAA